MNLYLNFLKNQILLTVKQNLIELQLNPLYTLKLLFLKSMQQQDLNNHLLAQTCQLALEAVKRKDEPGALPACVCQQFEKVATERSIEYISKDPAEGIPGATLNDLESLAVQLVDESAPLYSRYQAMFTLRNLGGDQAVKHLCDGLLSDNGSACFRHEVAFVLGQMEHEKATQALLSKLAEQEEHSVVRHEAAIALGSIGGANVINSLEQHMHDSEPIVAESCVVALATIAYWKYWDELEARLGM